MKAEIARRSKTEFMVLLHEGQDMGDWFWFPSMNAEALEQWWTAQETFENFFFDPALLPGELYQASDLQEEMYYLELRLSGQYYKADIITPLEGALYSPTAEVFEQQQAHAA